MTSLAHELRSQLAESLGSLGPDAPTLCEGWTTRDLAAHLIVRERRPDAALGIVVPPLSGYTDRVVQQVAGRSYDELLDAVRKPPVWSPFRLGPIDDTANVLEFVVHREDARRGGGATPTTDTSPALDAAIWARLSRMRRLLLRRAPATVRLQTPDGRSAGPETAELLLTGKPLELLMFCFGRQGAADVQVTGPTAEAAELRAAKLGI